MNYNKIIILDVEMTCWKTKEEQPNNSHNDIIEIGLVELDGITLDITRERQIFVNPISEISQYCTDLTGIDYKVLKKNSALKYDTAVNILIQKFGTKNKLCVGWGLDNRAFLNMEKRQLGENPISNNYLNLSQIFSIQQGITEKINLEQALNLSGLKFVGQAHSAIIDARNTAALFKKMFRTV